MPLALILVLVLALVGCKDESKQDADQKARQKAAQIAIQKAEEELEKKEQLIQSLSHERKARLRTVRLLGFLVLTGGSVAVLVWTNRPSPLVSRPSGNGEHAPRIMPEWRDARHRPTRSRIIDIPPQPARHAAQQSANHSGRQSSRNNRHTRNRT